MTTEQLPLQRPGSKVRCGTISGYRMHQEHAEKPCDACARSKRLYDARRAAAGDTQMRSRRSARAQQRALKRLKDQHPDEYRGLYETAKREIAAEVEQGLL